MKTFLMVIAGFLLLSSCASVNMKKASPAEYGYGLQMTPGWQIGDGNTSIHALASYAKLGFDGGNDNVYQFGGQVRYALPSSQPGGFWVGGEAAYVSFTSKYDNEELFVDGDPSATGFALGGMVGYRFPTQTLPISGFAGLGLVNFGDFTTPDNLVIDEGGTGFTARIGICLHLLSLLHEKGR